MNRAELQSIIYSWGGQASTSALIASLQRGGMNTEDDAAWEAWFSRVSRHLALYRLVRHDAKEVNRLVAPNSLAVMAAIIEQDSMVAEAASYHLDGAAAAAAGRVRDELDHLAGIASTAC